MPEESKEKKEETLAPVAESGTGAKKILEQLDKIAAAPAASEGAAAETVVPSPSTPQGEMAVESPSLPSREPQSKAQEIAAEPVAQTAPLISDAMRRLDELLARFRGSA